MICFVVSAVAFNGSGVVGLDEEDDSFGEDAVPPVFRQDYLYEQEEVSKV